MGLTWEEIVAIVTVSVVGLVNVILFAVYFGGKWDKKRKWYKALKRKLLKDPSQPMLLSATNGSIFAKYLLEVDHRKDDSASLSRQLRTTLRPNVHAIHNEMDSQTNSAFI